MGAKHPMQTSVANATGAPQTLDEYWDTSNSLMHAAGDMPKPDFSGWATKANVLCSDGRTILPDAFKHQHQVTVPLVWQHGHSSPDNVLGKAVLEHRAEGVYCYGYFNDSNSAKQAKALVQHEDIKSLSIFANQLKEAAKKVSHGLIREVSLVLAGANPGAMIDNIQLEHSDGKTVTIEDEAVITFDEPIVHGDGATGQSGTGTIQIPAPGQQQVEHAADDTVQKVYDGLTDEQKSVVHYMVGQAMELAGGAKHDGTGTGSAEHTDTKEQGQTMKMSRNLFEQQNGNGAGASDGGERHTISHDDLKKVVESAQKGGSLKAAMEEYALAHGVENLDLLFPDAKTLQNTPEWDKRRTEWVNSVLNGTRTTPFSRVKSIVADITMDDARARGYIKGNFKKEEWFGLTKRTTDSTTIYKKQQLDRDDIIDITDLDIVAWLKGEMRLMLDEELARCILIGDGRELDDEDKIRDPQAAVDGRGIRSILHDHDLYAATVSIGRDLEPAEMVDIMLENMRFYKGSGSPTLYTTTPVLIRMLTARDGDGRRMYRTASDLAAEIGVAAIQEVEVMEAEEDLLGIIVNLRDYNLGTNAGGQTTFFDDFDIDYNQYKYLLETRLSGALVKIRSALVVRFVDAGETLVRPVRPGFNADTGTITPATTAGVIYRRGDTQAEIEAPFSIAKGSTLKVLAVPVEGYYFRDNVEDEYTFTRPS